MNDEGNQRDPDDLDQAENARRRQREIYLFARFDCSFSGFVMMLPPCFADEVADGLEQQEGLLDTDDAPDVDRS
ncbi:MAG: hypothetical protein JJT88_09860 [Gammaproteobacteria bacterium]|nr:hypothetical protein [Gammaproteobacteria bacterium]